MSSDTKDVVMTASSQEFEPYEQIAHILKFWWFLVLCAILGGLAGLAAHRVKPPLYEAAAVFSANIDFNKIDFYHPPKPTPAPYKLTQYDEDITILAVQVSLVKVQPQVIAFAQANGWALDADGLKARSTIERKHDVWEVRVRSTDPQIAQKLVNYWAQAAFADLQEREKAGKLPVYLLYDLVQLADLPSQPHYFQTNVFVFAGGVVGILASILLLNLPFFQRK